MIRCLPLGAYAANCYLVYDEKKRAVVIDPGAEPDRLLTVIERDSLDVQAILLTHAHFDHLMASRELKEATGAPLYVHAADGEALTDPTYSLAPATYTVTADHLFQDGDVLTVGDLTFTVLHTPGHTAGSVCYACDGVLFAGDTLFAGGIGRTDLAGGDLHAICRSLHALSTLPSETRVLPGHGGETTIGFEKQYNPYMIG